MDPFWKRVRVSTTSLRPGHIVLVTDDGFIDLGHATVEDLKLTAYVTQEAAARLPSRKTKMSLTTLTRVRAFTKQLYDNAKT